MLSCLNLSTFLIYYYVYHLITLIYNCNTFFIHYSIVHYSIVQFWLYNLQTQQPMIVIDNQDDQTFKAVLAVQTYEQFLEIGQPRIISFLKHYFPLLLEQNPKIQINQNEKLFATLKKLVQDYDNMSKIISVKQPCQMTGIGNQQKAQKLDLQCRKNTRATLAMRNSKNKQELKKDQIFVRLIPRTHNCIHFMVKNNNFPRIECRLSCNQHLQYLLNYLTNKWLRGKVGVGYQIKLYPDPSTYMQKYSGEGKRPAIIHDPLNNYLMFTDIMAAFGVAQNGCINLLYDITELRKQKQKPSKGLDSLEHSSQNYTIKLHQPENSLFEQINHNPTGLSNNLSYKESGFLSSPISQKQKQPKLYREMREDKREDRADNFKIMTESREEICEQSDRKHPIGGGFDNSVGFSQVNSIGYQINAFNSNHILGTIFNMNNSNTFLNLYDRQKHNPDNQSQTPSKSDVKQNPKQTPEKNLTLLASQPTPYNSFQTTTCSKVNPNKTSEPASLGANVSNPANESKLQNIRNFINIIEKEVGPGNNECYGDMGDKQQNSMHKSESNLKREVKTVTIIKKKNQNE